MQETSLAWVRIIDVMGVNETKDHAQDARATIRKRHGAYLPHWTRDDAWYAVTFRLWDSLPQHECEVLVDHILTERSARTTGSEVKCYEAE